MVDLVRLAGRVGRDDLAGLLLQLRGAAEEREASVAVVGGYQTGKTSLIGALIGAALAPTGPAGRQRHRSSSGTATS